MPCPYGMDARDLYGGLKKIASLPKVARNDMCDVSFFGRFILFD
jgi:hypothetical protein